MLLSYVRHIIGNLLVRVIFSSVKFFSASLMIELCWLLDFCWFYFLYCGTLFSQKDQKFLRQESNFDTFCLTSSAVVDRLAAVIFDCWRENFELSKLLLLNDRAIFTYYKLLLMTLLVLVKMKIFTPTDASSTRIPIYK